VENPVSKFKSQRREANKGGSIRGKNKTGGYQIGIFAKGYGGIMHLGKSPN